MLRLRAQRRDRAALLRDVRERVVAEVPHDVLPRHLVDVLVGHAVLAEEVLASAESVRPASDEEIGWALNDLAELQLLLERMPLAETNYLRAQRVADGIGGGKNLMAATALNGLASVRSRQGRYRDALPLYERALALRRELGTPDDVQSGTRSAIARRGSLTPG